MLNETDQRLLLRTFTLNQYNPLTGFRNSKKANFDELFDKKIRSIFPCLLEQVKLFHRCYCHKILFNGDNFLET